VQKAAEKAAEKEAKKAAKAAAKAAKLGGEVSAQRVWHMPCQRNHFVGNR
jgi:hypothetical protein